MPATWNGSVSAGDNTSIWSTTTSTWPVGSAGIDVLLGAGDDPAVTPITLSSLIASATLNALDSGVKTHCVTP